MAKLRANFSLYSRKMKAGTVWYYRTYTPDNIRTAGKSTGCTTKSKARLYCEQLLKEGKLFDGKALTFKQFSQNWFIWGKCVYVKDKLTTGTKDKPGITEGYVSQLHGYLKLYYLPFFKNVKMENITPAKIKAWRSWLQDEKKIGNKTINNVAVGLRLMTDWALNEHVIMYDPFRSIKQLKTDDGTRDAFSITEALQILQSKWTKPIANLMNLTAALTGMRISEIRAIRKETLFLNYIDVIDQYGTHGIAPIKTKEKRKVPIPNYLYTLLKAETDKHFYAFQLGKKVTPANPLYAVRELYAVMPAEILAQQDKRGLCFHSWRHFFNSYLRAENVSDAKIMAVMGHSSGKGSMTDNYTSWEPEMYPEVYTAQEKLVALITKSK